MDSYKPIVIVGAPRSGTNMLRDVLCALDGVDTWPCDEINYIWRHGNVKVATDEFTPSMASNDIRKYIRTQFEKLAAEQECRFVVEKTCANSLRVGFVDQVLPDAHYVFITRNGMDVVSSANLRWTAKLDIPYLLKKIKYVPIMDLPYYGTRYLWSRVYRLFSGEKRLAFWGPQLKDMKPLLEKYSLNEICAIQWSRCVQNSLSDFSNIEDSRISKLSYEGFVSSPVEGLMGVLKDIGIVATQSQVELAVSRVSSKSIGKWKEQLSSDQVELIKPHVKHLMKDLGYDEF